MRQFKIAKKNGGVPAFNINNNESSMNAIQDFNNGQIYTKGFTFGASAGAAVSFSPQLGGKAKQLHGIAIFYPNANVNDNDIVSLVINSEQLIDGVIWRAYTPISSGNNFKPDQFFELKRALSGSDSVEFSIRADNAHNAYVVFYLSNSNK